MKYVKINMNVYGIANYDANSSKNCYFVNYTQYVFCCIVSNQYLSIANKY